MLDENKVWAIDEDARKFHYWRGFAIGASLVFIVCSSAFVIFCSYLLKVV